MGRPKGSKNKKNSKLIIENDNNTKKQRKKKKIKQTFKTQDIVYETNKIILRIEDRMGGCSEIVKEYEYPIRFNKHHEGSLTEYLDGKWGKIMQVITDEKDLTYLICPVD